MVQPVKVPSINLMAWVPFPGSTWWKDRIDSYYLSLDLHKCTVVPTKQTRERGRRERGREGGDRGREVERERDGLRAGEYSSPPSPVVLTQFNQSHNLQQVKGQRTHFIPRITEGLFACVTVGNVPL